MWAVAPAGYACENKKPNHMGSAFVIAGEEGIEPPLTVLETAALPLYYSPMSLADEMYSNTP